MSRRREHMSQTTHAKLISDMWGLTVSISFSEDREDPDGFAYPEMPEKMAFHPGDWESSEGTYQYGPGGLHPTHIEDSLDG